MSTSDRTAGASHLPAVEVLGDAAQNVNKVVKKDPPHVEKFIRLLEERSF